MTQPNIESENTKNYIEVQKVVFDYVKHITTLNTGTIILLTILLDKIFKTQIGKEFAALTFISLIISLIFLTACGFGIIRSIKTPRNISNGLMRFTTVSFIIGASLFILGIIFLAIFSILNWL